MEPIDNEILISCQEKQSHEICRQMDRLEHILTEIYLRIRKTNGTDSHSHVDLSVNL